MQLTLGQIADWMHAEGDFTTSTLVTGYSIDSRTVSAGELFFAVTGERVDGHEFVAAALRNGAAAAVVSRHWLAPDELDPCRLLWVPESEDCVLKAMQTLARNVRRTWGRRVIGVTGSAGKTTTKEAIAQVLGAGFRVFKSAGNLNNHFGVPLQLLKLEPEHEVAVIEMGMNHAGEIRRLAEIAEPDWAVVSNVSAVHLEHFADGIEGIARAKYELVEAIPPSGYAILNADDERVRTFRHGLGERAVLYGLAQDAAVRADEVEDLGLGGTRFRATAGGRSTQVELKLLGRHNVHNALAALACGWLSGMELDLCARALSELLPGDKRGAVIEWRGARLINDCYNSNPAALSAMTDALRAMPVGEGGRRVVIAGEMLELGEQGAALHAACGRAMAGIDLLVGVRGLARNLVEGARSAGVDAVFVESPEEAGTWMNEHVRAGDVVLLKASRGVRLESALAHLHG